MSDSTAYIGCAMYFWGVVLIGGGVSIGYLAYWVIHKFF